MWIDNRAGLLLVVLLLTGCGDSKVRNEDGSSTPKPGIFGQVSDKERLMSLPTVQRRRAVALALLSRYEILQMKSVKRVEMTAFKANMLGGGESACAKVELFDPLKGKSSVDVLSIALGAAGVAPMQIMDWTRGIMIGGCTGDVHSDFPEFMQVKDALANKRDPLTLAAQ
jgi:hypothetical protein